MLPFLFLTEQKRYDKRTTQTQGRFPGINELVRRSSEAERGEKTEFPAGAVYCPDEHCLLLLLLLLCGTKNLTDECCAIHACLLFV